jgi:hypothetical protein
MAKALVRFTREHTVIRPATVLETHNFDGTVTHIADIPEARTVYVTGETHTFRSAKDALAFVKAMDGAAELVKA